MKSIFLSLLFICTLVHAQDSEMNRISLSVVLPDNSELLSRQVISKVESKIQHLVTRNGISGSGYSNNFLIYPKIEIFDESVVEGMRNIIVVEIEFNLFIQEYATKKIFSSYNTSLQGSGVSKNKAILNAISKIPTQGKELNEFISQGKSRIIEYYNNSCSQIVKDSEFMVKTQKFQQAIALLTSIPREANTCYAKIQDKTIEAFNQYQNQLCKTNLVKAKVELARNNYSKALTLLSFVDVSSNCSNEVETLLGEIAEKIDKEEEKQANLILNRYKDKQNMEKYRLEITKEIAKAYYKSKPKSIVYRSLF